MPNDIVQCTSALRNTLAQDPAMALIAVTHALAAELFYQHAAETSCLEIKVKSAWLSGHAPDIDDTATAIAYGFCMLCAHDIPPRLRGGWPP